MIFCFACTWPIPAADRLDPEALQQELQKRTGREFRIHSASVLAIVTDASDEVGAACMRHLYPMLPKMRGFMRIPSDSAPPQIVAVALFSRREEFLSFVSARAGPNCGSYTYLHSADPTQRVIAGHVLASRPMLARLNHAACSALLHAWIAEPPLWLKEGLGEALEDLQAKEESVALGPARSHIRDYREVFCADKEHAALTLKKLVSGTQDEWDRNPFGYYTLAWAFCRYLLEDKAMQDARLLEKIYQALSPDATLDANTKRVAEVFLDDEWMLLTRKMTAFLDALAETPGEEPYKKSRALLAEGRYADAMGLLDKAIELDPQYERLYYYRGLASSRVGKAHAAAADLTAALGLFPEYTAARYLRGQCYIALNAPHQARPDLEACLETSYRERAQKALAGLK